MLQSDRGELRQVATPTLAAILAAGSGCQAIRDSELLTGAHRNLYTQGQYLIDVDASGAVVRAYKQLP